MRERYLRLEVDCDGKVYGTEIKWNFMDEDRGVVKYMLEDALINLNKECPANYTIIFMDTGLCPEYIGD